MYETTPTPGAQSPDARQQDWGRCVKLVRKLHRRGEFEQFAEAVKSGAVQTDKDLVWAAEALVLHADVGSWVPPAPTAEQLADVEAWAKQAAADHQRTARDRKWQRELAGLPPNRGSGQPIGPVWQQKSKLTLEQLTQRLERVIAEHQWKHDGFDRKWLDPHHANFLKGGITNKQIPLFANEIVGQAEERSYDANWKIVTDYLDRRRANQAADENAAE
jgi:hypothetical protein